MAYPDSVRPEKAKPSIVLYDKHRMLPVLAKQAGVSVLHGICDRAMSNGEEVMFPVVHVW